MKAMAHVFLLLSLAGAATVVERQWTFASAASARFEIADTLAVSVRFPDAIPDDRLIGYTRLRVMISDSSAGAPVPGAVLRYRILLDAGFLYFSHELTFEMPLDRGLLGPEKADPRRYFMRLDPFPVTGLHIWGPLNTFRVDTAARVIRFSYTHQRYISPAGLSKAMVASKGYPYEYGLFLSDSVLQVRPGTSGQRVVAGEKPSRTPAAFCDLRGRLLLAGPPIPAARVLGAGGIAIGRTRERPSP